MSHSMCSNATTACNVLHNGPSSLLAAEVHVVYSSSMGFSTCWKMSSGEDHRPVGRSYLSNLKCHPPHSIVFLEENLKLNLGLFRIVSSCSCTNDELPCLRMPVGETAENKCQRAKVPILETPFKATLDQPSALDYRMTDTVL